MPEVTEIAPNVYLMSVFYPEINLSFNHFLVKDEEPLLFHTGLRRMFPQVREGVEKVIDLAKLRWISWSHFELTNAGRSMSGWRSPLTLRRLCGWSGAWSAPMTFAGRSAASLHPKTP